MGNLRGRPAKRRREVMAFVEASVQQNGRAPSYGEICDSLGIRTRHEVSRIVGCLEAQGLLRRAGAGRVRRIHLT